MHLTITIDTGLCTDLLDQTLAHLGQLVIPQGVEWELLVANDNHTDHADEVIARHTGRLPLRRLSETTPGKPRDAKLSVSVVIPTYNRARMIGRAIESVLRQTRPPDQIIIVDDASTDDTRSVIEGFQRRVPSLSAVFQPRNGGPAATRNRGLDEVRGDVVAFLDSDDYWEDDHLESCVGFLEDRPDLDVVFADIRTVHPDGRVISPSALWAERGISRLLVEDPSGSGRYAFQAAEADAIIDCYFLGIQASVVRLAAIPQRFDEDNAFRGAGEDNLYFMRLALGGGRFGYVNRVGCNMVIHDGNLISNGRNAAGANLAWAQAYMKLLDMPGLAPQRRRALLRRAADCYHNLGYRAYLEGERIKSLGYYRKSLGLQFSWKGAKAGLFAAVMPSALIHRRHGVVADRSHQEIETAAAANIRYAAG